MRPCNKLGAFDMVGLSSLIPMARDARDDKLIKPDRATLRAERGRYICLDPKCHRELTVAVSKYGKVHFRHYRNSGSATCLFSCRSSRSQHEAAKQLLLVLLGEAIQRRAPMPMFEFNLLSGQKTVIPFLLADEVRAEWNCSDINRRPDIAILYKGEPVLFIEIFHTHAVDQFKKLDLDRYWWIEIAAIDVLINPWSLNVRAHGNLPYELEVRGHQEELFSNQQLPSMLLSDSRKTLSLGSKHHN